MSLIQDVKAKAKHRGMTPWQLVQKIRRLEREADAATCQMVALATENDELKAERNELRDDFDKAAIDYSAVLEDLQAANDEIAELRRQLAPFLAAKANANRVDVPCGVRDNSALEDQATVPHGVDVRTLQEAAAAGLLGPIGPVTDPGRITTH